MNDKLTILIADNVEKNRMWLQKFYEREYHVLMAADGCGVLEILHKEKVDIMILELCMPNGEGENILQQVKSNDQWKDIPVIVKAVEPAAEKGKIIAMGADDYFVLPDETDQMRGRVESIAGRVAKSPKVLKYSEISLLLIDDDAIVVEYAKMNLRRLGIQCKTADSAELAVQMIEDAQEAGKPFDLCLINRHMRQTDGAVIVKKIRERFDKRKILISCICREESACRQEMESEEIDYVLERPLTQGKLYRLMAAVKHDLEKNEAVPLRTFPQPNSE